MRYVKCLIYALTHVYIVGFALFYVPLRLTQLNALSKLQAIEKITRTKYKFNYMHFNFKNCDFNAMCFNSTYLCLFFSYQYRG